MAELVGLSGDPRLFNATARFESKIDATASNVAKVKARSSVLGGAVAPVYQAIGMSVALGILGYASKGSVDVPALGAVAILLMRSVSYGRGHRPVTTS